MKLNIFDFANRKSGEHCGTEDFILFNFTEEKRANAWSGVKALTHSFGVPSLRKLGEHVSVRCKNVFIDLARIFSRETAGRTGYCRLLTSREPTATPRNAHSQ